MSFGTRYLRHPDLFPARPSGEPWGPASVDVHLPGGPYHVVGLAPHQEAVVRRRFGALCRPSDQGGEGVEIQVFRAAEDGFLPVDTRGWEYSLDVDYGERHLRLAGVRFMARIHWRPGLGAGLWTSLVDSDLFELPIANLLRIVTAYRLAELGGILLHGAAAVDWEGAYVFFGRSGAGKSTLGRLSLETGRPVLADDVVAVLPGEAGPMAAGLPFGGDLEAEERTSGSYPVRLLCSLVKGPQGARSPLRPAAAVAKLAACAPVVNADPYRNRTLLENLERIASAVPVETLTFSLREDPWKVLAP